MRQRRVPDVVINRLPLYLRVLSDIDVEQTPIISSYELGEKTGVTPGQIRKDLSLFGVFGKQGVGYEVSILRGELRRILKLNRVVNVGLVGVGNLGQAFLHYGADRQREILNREGLRMRAAFDTDARKIGCRTAVEFIQCTDARTHQGTGFDDYDPDRPRRGGPGSCGPLYRQRG